MSRLTSIGAAADVTRVPAASRRRRTTRCVVAAATLLALHVASLDAQRTTTSDSALARLLAARVAIGRNPGIAALRITPAGVETAYVGRAASPDGAPMGPRTLFEIGSITKAITGTLLADAIRRGELLPDQPVWRWLPGLPIPAGGDSISFLDLATHRSGIVSFPPGYRPPDSGDPYAMIDSAVVANVLASAPLRFPRGTQAEYSNIGAGLLGRALVTRARARDYESLVRTRLAQPLGMGADFTITLTPEQQRRFATGHLASGDTTAHWRIPYLAGAGAIIASLPEMQRLAEACLGKAPAQLAASIAAAQRPRRDFQGAMRIGLHWIVFPRPDSSAIVWHNGGTGGFRSWLGCNRRTGRAAVVLTNGDTGVDDIGLHLVDSTLALRPPSARVVRTEVAIDTLVMDSLVGRYRISPQFAITITRQGPRLLAQATDQPQFELFAESRDRWFLKVVEAAIEFERDSTGRVTGLVLEQGGGRPRFVREP
ncbi:MAG: serine hydrolase [Gemmatimonadaceae bacterium]|jgi:CubicO group peptidase (beta-lactamase class C family)|nr:serine hydrolase [Gemmatimonadaceae bacterium]